MIAVFCIIAVVASISLYDFFNTRSWQQVTSNERNDTVFKERNREYGAFMIRRDYDKRVMIIVLSLVGGMGVLYATTRGTIKKVALKAPTKEILLTFDPNQKPVETPALPETRPEQTSSAPATAFTEPVITDHDPIDGPQLPPDDGSNVGAVPGIGDPGFTAGPPGPPSIGDPGILPPTPPVSPTEIYVDEPAEYPGGRGAMLSYLSGNINYPQIAIELGLEGKCYLKFIVSKTGNISEVTVQRGVPDCKECDKEAVRVVKGMPDWKPGKIKGKPVDSYFNLPVAFTFQK